MQKRHYIFSLFFNLCLFFFCSIYFIQITKAETESAQASENRINQYCEDRLKINRTNLEYTGNEDFQKTTFQDLKEKYHQDMNKLFGDPTVKMIENVEKTQSLEQKCSNKSITKQIQKGVSTYELSQKALCRYALYSYALNQKQKQINQNIQTPELQEIIQDISGTENSNLQTNTFQALSIYRNNLETELEISKIAFQNALAAYDEMIVMYPLHIRLKCIISDLSNFRTEFGSLVKVFYCLERFINAASDKLN